MDMLKFQRLLHALRPVDVDLFVSRLCQEIPRYLSQEPDLYAWMVDAFDVNLDT